MALCHSSFIYNRAFLRDKLKRFRFSSKYTMGVRKSSRKSTPKNPQTRTRATLPSHKYIPGPQAANFKGPGSRYHPFLQQFAQHPDNPLVHSRSISYLNVQERCQWSPNRKPRKRSFAVQDWDTYDTMKDFLSTLHKNENEPTNKRKKLHGLEYERR
ncbi:hypothetical protein BCR34DRAFT_582417 [Clohesyomyces aquaticus]|uniref:Uncharacterized protein n=1 Tax=Clohesyomyces aquaticus TaxID=1231657 RepID=A0A1Y2A9N0_9PLEO|nr:hypothetical protein BCR34DRAFT_582417 [Clohesyomyces aquaticus]